MLRLIITLLLAITHFSNATVIAHRGASGYLPEHTLASITLAYGLGADFIEQDVVLSKDEVAIVLHDIHLETVTDVEQVFPQRHRKDGRYYAIDFNFDELQTLTVHERQTADGKQVYPKRYNGNQVFKIATLEQQIQRIQDLNASTGGNVGFYPEIKAPKWHRQQGMDISQIVVKILRKYKLDHADAPIFLQCFDFAELKRIRNTLKAKLPLIQLIGENSWQESDSDYDYLRSDRGLAEIAAVAQGVGPWYPQLIQKVSNKWQTKAWARQAQGLGLLIHPYTHRVDDLPDGTTSDELLHQLFEVTKIDGIFSDFPDAVVTYLKQQSHSVDTITE